MPAVMMLESLKNIGFSFDEAKGKCGLTAFEKFVRWVDQRVPRF